MLRTFSTLIDRGLKTKYFLLAVVLVVLFRFLDFFPVLVNYYSIVDGKLDLGYSTMELYGLTGYTMFGLIMLVVSVIPFSGKFCDDLESNLTTYMLMKTGKSAYCNCMVVVCAISSFLCVFIGELIVVFVLSGLTPMYNIKYYTMSGAVQWILLRIILLGLQGAFYGLITMLMSIFTKNKYIVFTSPVLLYFFFALFCTNIFKIPTKLNPAYIFRNFIFKDGKEIESVILACIYLIILMVITSRVMNKKIERCY